MDRRKIRRALSAQLSLRGGKREVATGYNFPELADEQVLIKCSLIVFDDDPKNVVVRRNDSEDEPFPLEGRTLEEVAEEILKRLEKRRGTAA